MSCTQKNYDIHINQGADWFLEIIITNTAGQPVDITGRVFHGQIRTSYDDTVIIAEMTGTITDAVNGRALMSLTNAQTSAIPVGPSGGGPNRPYTIYIYDIEMTMTDGTKIRIRQGRALVSPEVTLS